MGFGPHFLARKTTDNEIHGWIRDEAAKGWDVIGMGDFAVGVWNAGAPKFLENGRKIRDDVSEIEICILEGEDAMEVGEDIVDWVGYVGVRDGRRGMPAREEGEKPLPPWPEMVELAYGYNMPEWGKGYGTEAAGGLMLWAEKEMGVKRFIAETERENVGSGKLLKRLEFKERIGIEYWKTASEIEWEKVVRDRAD